MKKIYIGADHAGFKLKEKIKSWLDRKGIIYEDCGDLILDMTDDYPLYAGKVAQQALKHKSLGVLLCGSAQGVCIAANKIKGIRAVVPFSLKEARLSKEHTDANILCLSGWYTHFHQATLMINIFLNTSFSHESRHVRRLNQIKKMERSK